MALRWRDTAEEKQTWCNNINKLPFHLLQTDLIKKKRADRDSIWNISSPNKHSKTGHGLEK